MYSNNSLRKKKLTYVKKMASHFEEIAGATTYEANFKHCNWWLDMPALTCFEDGTQDSSLGSQDSLNKSRHSSSHDVLTPIDGSTASFPMDGENSAVHEIEIAEAASDHVFPENDSAKETFIKQIDSLSFTEDSTDDNNKAELVTHRPALVEIHPVH